MLLILMAAAALVFVVACANAANLVLARTLSRQPEMAIRAALGASRGNLRGALLAECLLLSAGGALVGLLIAGPAVTLLARIASRVTVRAEDLTLDPMLPWVAAALSMVAAMVFAFIPRLPSADSTGGGLPLATSAARTTDAARGRQRAFAVAQIAASFVLLAGAGLLTRTLLALHATEPGFETGSVLAINVPVTTFGRSLDQVRLFYENIQQRVSALPGVTAVAVGSSVPWRDVDDFGGDFEFTVDGRGDRRGRRGSAGTISIRLARVLSGSEHPAPCGPRVHGRRSGRPRARGRRQRVGGAPPVPGSGRRRTQPSDGPTPACGSSRSAPSHDASSVSLPTYVTP